MDPNADIDAPLDADMDQALSAFAASESDAVAAQHGGFQDRVRARLAVAPAAVRPAPTAVASKAPRRWIAYASIAASFIAAAAFGYMYANRQRPDAGAIAYREGIVIEEHLRTGAMPMSTCGGGRFIAAIDDGRVQLFANAETSLTIESNKKVHLQSGEVWVVIRPNSGPFEVTTPRLSASVQGTIFGMKENTVTGSVTVQRGKVRVSNGNGAVELTAGASAAATCADGAPEASAPGEVETPPWAAELQANAAKAVK